MIWPKKWVDAINLSLFTTDDILTRLNHVGALKEIPQPKEYFLCTACLQGFSIQWHGDHSHSCHHPNPELLRVREVGE